MLSTGLQISVPGRNHDYGHKETLKQGFSKWSRLTPGSENNFGTGFTSLYLYIHDKLGLYKFTLVQHNFQYFANLFSIEQSEESVLDNNLFIYIIHIKNLQGGFNAWILNELFLHLMLKWKVLSWISFLKNSLKWLSVLK